MMSLILSGGEFQAAGLEWTILTEAATFTKLSTSSANLRQRADLRLNSTKF